MRFGKAIAEKKNIFSLVFALTFHYLCKRKAAVRHDMSDVMTFPDTAFHITVKTESIHTLTLHMILL